MSTCIGFGNPDRNRMKQCSGNCRMVFFFFNAPSQQRHLSISGLYPNACHYAHVLSQTPHPPTFLGRFRAADRNLLHTGYQCKAQKRASAVAGKGYPYLVITNKLIDRHLDQGGCGKSSSFEHKRTPTTLTPTTLTVVDASRAVGRLGRWGVARSVMEYLREI